MTMRRTESLKSPVLAVILTFLFGGFGFLYVSVGLGLIIIVVQCVVSWMALPIYLEGMAARARGIEPDQTRELVYWTLYMLSWLAPVVWAYNQTVAQRQRVLLEREREAVFHTLAVPPSERLPAPTATPAGDAQTSMPLPPPRPPPPLARNLLASPTPIASSDPASPEVLSPPERPPPRPARRPPPNVPVLTPTPTPTPSVEVSAIPASEGTPATPETAAPPATSVTAPAPATTTPRASATLFCDRCGVQQRPDARFCRGCGAALPG
jgi:hypothetical protein